ncbi:hypothetical protein HDA32_005944 [Spinactinospora alkalitolerans]|uniref:Uncharacterized protein n=1 Tax=Spinactinospora alkalitolerans TaxID=687207 RepID=A0A852U9N7_9ACTN|nr:hypothetical protein [Spinactinospora alkalitolerans]NYE50824.1 hypothetical protein [Spinactinospora alkalitolerans]
MNVRRIATVGAIAPAIALAAPGLAMADSFEQSGNMAGPDGASSHSVSASSGGTGGGGASYEESHQWAGPDGAGSSSTSSNAGGSGDEGLLGGLGLGGIL